MRSLRRHDPYLSRLPPAVPVAVCLALVMPLIAGVSVEFDREVDFGPYTTYTWGEGTPARRPDVQDLIVAAIDRELGARGLRKVDGGAPLKVHTHALVDEHTLEKLADPTYFKFWSGINVIDPKALKTGSSAEQG